jgi:hypothetical protein
MKDGVSTTKAPRELRAEKCSRDKGEWISPTSKNKRAKTKDKTSVSPNLDYKKGTKNKNLDSQDLAINLANKNKWPMTKNKNLASQDLAINLANKDKWPMTKNKNLDSQNLALNLANKNKRKLEDSQTFEPSKLRQTKARMDRESKVKCIKHKEHEIFTFAKAPKPTPIEEWVGHQPNDLPKNGRFLEDEEKLKHLPSKLVMALDDKKRKRISVPLAQQLPLTIRRGGL